MYIHHFLLTCSLMSPHYYYLYGKPWGPPSGSTLKLIGSTLELPEFPWCCWTSLRKWSCRDSSWSKRSDSRAVSWPREMDTWRRMKIKMPAVTWGPIYLKLSVVHSTHYMGRCQRSSILFILMWHSGDYSQSVAIRLVVSVKNNGLWENKNRDFDISFM